MLRTRIYEEGTRASSLRDSLYFDGPARVTQASSLRRTRFALFNGTDRVIQRNEQKLGLHYFLQVMRRKKVIHTLYTLEKNPDPMCSWRKSSNRNKLDTACFKALKEGPGVRSLSGDLEETFRTVRSNWS